MEQLLWFKYQVHEPLNWVGHLAIMREFERAWRRSGLPVAHSQGFNPRIRQSFGLPLVVGATSACEYGEIRLSQWTALGQVHEKLAQAINPHIVIDKLILAPTLKSSLMQLLRYADYSLKVFPGGEALEQAVHDFQTADQRLIHKKTKKHVRELDIKPLVRRLAFSAPDSLDMRLSSSETGTVKPLELLHSLGEGFDAVRLHRQASLDADEKPLF